MKKFFEKISEKFKNSKSLQIAFVVFVIAIVFVIYFSTISNKKQVTQTSQISDGEYVSDLENRLCKVLSNISGAGKVDVMITVSGNGEYEIAYTTEERQNNTTSSSSNSTTKTPVIITSSGSNSPIILSQKNPEIVGVIIVAQGADNVKVKMDLLRATVALLNIPLSSIEIFAGK